MTQINQVLNNAVMGVQRGLVNARQASSQLASASEAPPVKEFADLKNGNGASENGAASVSEAIGKNVDVKA